MKTKIFNLPDAVAKDLETLVANGQQTKWVLDAIQTKLALPHNVRLLASIREARAQHNGGMPPNEVLPPAVKKDLALW